MIVREIPAPQQLQSRTWASVRGSAGQPLEADTPREAIELALAHRNRPTMFALHDPSDYASWVAGQAAADRVTAARVLWVAPGTLPVPAPPVLPVARPPQVASWSWWPFLGGVGVGAAAAVAAYLVARPTKRRARPGAF